MARRRMDWFNGHGGHDNVMHVTSVWQMFIGKSISQGQADRLSNRQALDHFVLPRACQVL